MSDFRNDPDYVQRRREIIRTHHPDSGGSSERLIKELKKLDEQFAHRRAARAQWDSLHLDFLTPEQHQRAAHLIDSASDVATDAARRASEVRVRASRIGAATKKGIRDQLQDSTIEKVARRAGRIAGTIHRRMRGKNKG